MNEKKQLSNPPLSDSRELFGLRRTLIPMDIDVVHKKNVEKNIDRQKSSKENLFNIRRNRNNHVAVSHTANKLFARYKLPNEAITEAFLGDAVVLSDIIREQTTGYGPGLTSTVQNPKINIFGKEWPLNQLNIKVCTLFFDMFEGQTRIRIKKLPIMHHNFLSLIIMDHEETAPPDYLIEIVAKTLAEIQIFQLQLPLTVNVDFYRSRSTEQNIFHQDKHPVPNVKFVCLQYLNLEPMLIAGPEILILGDNALSPEQQQSIIDDSASVSLKSSTFLRAMPNRQLQSCRLLADANTCMFFNDDLCTHATPQLNPGMLDIQPAQISIPKPQLNAVFKLARGQHRVEFGPDSVSLSQPPPPNRAFLRYWYSPTIVGDFVENESVNPLILPGRPGNRLFHMRLRDLTRIKYKKNEYLYLMRVMQPLSVEQFVESKFNRGGKTKKNKTKKNKTKKNKTKKKGGAVTLNNETTVKFGPTINNKFDPTVNNETINNKFDPTINNSTIVTNKLKPIVTNKLDNVELPNFIIKSDKILVNFLYNELNE